MIISEEAWLVSRIWELLEAPESLGCRPVSKAWVSQVNERQSLTSSAIDSRAKRRLRVPHIAVPAGFRARALLRWATAHVSATDMFTLALPPSSDSAATAFEAVLSRVVEEGSIEWVAWLLDASSLGGLATSQPSPSSDPAAPIRLRRGDCDAAEPSLLKGAKGFEPLRIAASAGHAEIVCFLLARRADVDETDENDCTALHWAADKGWTGCCRDLIVAKACVDARDDDNWTPLCLAADQGHVEVCEELLRHGASVNLPDEDLRSPLWWAAWRRHFRIVDLLVASRADLSQGDFDGISPEGLLEKSMTRKSGNLQGTMPLSFARFNH
eukprot:TRINITY_DN23771_c0_g1_i1.p1 TRINITY_DN23771_c0_g1~~TRINITY_DN23771_c0_g1_i1.p1  ORF type:complete len:352 (-),score=44.62 TRINITY_DN23771_c0_g1_i1:143-1123(-)